MIKKQIFDFSQIGYSPANSVHRHGVLLFAQHKSVFFIYEASGYSFQDRTKDLEVPLCQVNRKMKYVMNITVELSRSKGSSLIRYASTEGKRVNIP